MKKQQTVASQGAVSTTPDPSPSPSPTPKKARQRETTYAGKLGDWQRILTPFAANAADLAHLDVPRAKLAALLAQAVEIKQQQAAGRATKQAASEQLQKTIVEGQRVAALLRQAVKQHYGPSSEKLAEFNLKVFRGRAKGATSTPQSPAPPPSTPSVEVASHPAAAVAKSVSDPTPHS